MTPDQAIEAARLVKQRITLKEKLAEIDGRLKKIGVDLPPEK